MSLGEVDEKDEKPTQRLTADVTALFPAISLRLFLGGLITALSANTSDPTWHFNYLLYKSTRLIAFLLTHRSN